MLEDSVLLFNAVICALFGMPHILKPDGNLHALGFAWTTSFMPKSALGRPPLPEELRLMVTHLAAMLGAAQLTVALICLLLVVSSVDKSTKKLVIAAILFYDVLTILLQFSKPAGTGVEGSPEAGPLPLLVALAVPTAAGLF